MLISTRHNTVKPPRFPTARYKKCHAIVMRRKQTTQMGSVNHPKLYDPAMMATIKAAFHDVWSTVEADGSRGDPVRDEDCKAAIIRRLLDLAATGTLARDELVAKLLSDRPCP